MEGDGAGGRSVHVAFAADEAYAMPLAAAVRSVIDHKDADVQLAVTVLSSGLGERSKARLERSWRHPEVTVSFHEVDAEHRSGHLAGLDHRGGLVSHVSPATFARFLLPVILPPSCRRVLYLDTDTITRTCLSPLMVLPLAGAPLAAAPSVEIPNVSSPLGVQRWAEEGLDAEAPYFNAGVMVIDLDAWRRLGLVERAIDYLVRHAGATLLYDQEGLNAAVAGAFTPLDATWNVMSAWHGRRRRVGPHAGILERARIRHFTGPRKPWTTRAYERTGAAAFFAALDRTDWRGWRPASGR